MLKKQIYPKTTRLKLQNKVFVTEKVDGSNMTLFKKNNNLYLSTRNNIINIDNELEESKSLLYKGMYGWLIEHKDYLKEQILEGSVICGEWIGMGKLSYTIFDKKLYMFAKANINDEFNLYNLRYDHELFIYPFENQIIPDFIGIVPEVITLNNIPTIDELNNLYDEYTKQQQRDIEGFVINFNNNIFKYVRMKNGILTDHFERGE